MPRIFDNIETPLMPALQKTLQVARRADFCVGYFNLRGWQHLAPHMMKSGEERRGEERRGEERRGEENGTCRLLVGMHVSPSEELRHALRHQNDDELLDNQTAQRDKREGVQNFV